MSIDTHLPPRPRPYTLRPARRPDFGAPAIRLAENRHLGEEAGPLCVQAFREGEIYEGTFSITGSDGPPRRWIVVAPWGKHHIHSMEPERFRCWPLNPLVEAIAAGRARGVGFDPDHPMVRLQREKERRGLHDTHLQMDSIGLEAMLLLLEEARAAGADFAPYAIAEIRSQLTLSPLGDEQRNAVARRLDAIAATLLR